MTRVESRAFARGVVVGALLVSRSEEIAGVALRRAKAGHEEKTGKEVTVLQWAKERYAHRTDIPWFRRGVPPSALDKAYSIINTLSFVSNELLL